MTWWVGQVQQPARSEPCLRFPPPIYETVCLGRITAEQHAPDGRYYLVVQGLSRARISQEKSADLPYRVAELRLHPDPDSIGTEAIWVTAAAPPVRRCS